MQALSAKPSQNPAQGQNKAEAGLGGRLGAGLSTAGKADALAQGAVDKLGALLGGGAAGGKLTDHGAKLQHGAELARGAAASKTGHEAEQAAMAGALAGAAKHTDAATARNVAPALEAAAGGASLSEQRKLVSGPVTMSAADAVALRSQQYAEQGAQAGVGDPAMRERLQAANQPGSGYQSPFIGVGLSGIRNVEDQAKGIDQKINGASVDDSHGYAAYAPSPTLSAPSWIPTMGGIRDKVQDGMNKAASGLDAINDVAAVTQYAAAADLAVKINRDPNGGGNISVDWAALSKMQVSADLNVPGAEQKINYQTPAQVAQGGYNAVMAEIDARGGQKGDKGQFISLTGHSGGGQSSFYTALKLASEGYTNISLVGVDMAMTPHQREALEALGVKVTNITSNNAGATGTDGKTAAPTNSEIGEVIRLGMGGGQNYYDLNVQRQSATDAVGRHDITNDVNVASMVRYSQYLDAIGQHGNYSPQLYQQFLSDTNGTGNQLDGRTASPSLLQNTQDNRSRPSTPEAGSGQTFAQQLLSVMTPAGANGAVDGLGTSVRNSFDQAGDDARNWIRGGGLPGTGWLGDRVNDFVDGLGNRIANGLDQVGNWAGARSQDAITWLQRTGIDTSHVAGLEANNGNNPSVTRNWAGLLSRPGSPEAQQIQTMPIVTPNPPSQGAPAQLYAN